eukprot:EG_transcript_4124
MPFPRPDCVDLTASDDEADTDVRCADAPRPPPPKRQRLTESPPPCRNGGACSSRCWHGPLDHRSPTEEVVVALEEQPEPSSPECPESPDLLWEPSDELTVLDTELLLLRDRCPCAGSVTTAAGLVVRLPIDTGHIGCMRSGAWGISTTQPIVVEILLPAGEGPPTVCVYQSDDPDLNRPAVAHRTDALGLMQYFLQSRAERRLRELWEAAVSEVAAGGSSSSAAAVPGAGASRVLKGGTLAELFSYLDFRFNTAASHCIMCDRDLEITTVSLTVCDAVPCQAFYRTASCGSLVSSALRHSPQVVDLLLNLLMAACQRSNQKHYGVPLPYAPPRGKADPNKQNFLPPPSRVPTVAMPVPGRLTADGLATLAVAPFEPFPYDLGFDTKRRQNVLLLMDTCNKLPALQSLQGHLDDTSLKAALDATDPLLFLLLKWVLCSTRMFLSLVPPEDCLKDLHTPYQFKVLASNPEHERAYQGWCAQARQHLHHPTGTYFGFHGSPISNWHSVLRAGLRCSPNGMLGPGVYAHETAHYSQAYMGQPIQTGPNGRGYFQLPVGGVWRNSMFQPDGGSMSMMALVEIADLRHDHSLIKTSEGNNSVSDCTMVAVRYLFFFPHGQQKQLTALASRLPIKPDLLAEFAPSNAPAIEQCSLQKFSEDPQTKHFQLLHSRGMLHIETCSRLHAFICKNNLACKKGARKEQLLQVVQAYLAALGNAPAS